MDHNASNKRLKASDGSAVPSAVRRAPDIPLYRSPYSEAYLPFSSGPPPSAIDTTRSTATVQRPSRTPSGRASMRLTVKAPPSKLRQATSGTSLPSSPSTASTPPTAPVNNARPSRASRNPRKIVEVDTSEEEEEDEDEDEDAEGEEDADAEIDIDEEILAAEDSEPDAEDSDAEADADADMDTDDAAPRPPVIKVQPPSSNLQPDGKMHVTVTGPPHDAPLRSVETAEADDEDEEL
ncbi:hypothetical protein LTR28_001797, partial [Elasticomyces elasticus]